MTSIFMTVLLSRPYLPNPTQHNALAPYFSRQWQQSLFISCNSIVIIEIVFEQTFVKLFEI